MLWVFLLVLNDVFNLFLYAACATGSSKSVRWLLKYGVD